MKISSVLLIIVLGVFHNLYAQSEQALSEQALSEYAGHYVAIIPVDLEEDELRLFENATFKLTAAAKVYIKKNRAYYYGTDSKITMWLSTPWLKTVQILEN